MEMRRSCVLCHGTGINPYFGYQVLRFLCPLCNGPGYEKEDKDSLFFDPMEEKKEEERDHNDDNS